MPRRFPLRRVCSFVLFSLSFAAPAFADATLIISSRLPGPLSATLIAPDGRRSSATDDDGDGVLSVVAQRAGIHQLTVVAGAQSDTTSISVPRTGTLAIAFDTATHPPLAVTSVEAAEAITVTAPKREQLLQDVPMSIDAIPQRELEDLGATQFNDYARTVPGLTFVDRGPNQTQIILRGVSPLVGESTVGLYIDGLSLASNFNNPDLHLFDVEQIEVVRGPQGTLYGEGAMGGTINITTHKPAPAAFDAKIDAVTSATREGGQNYELQGMVNVPLVDDRLALRIVGHTGKRDGWIDNTFLGIDDVNDEETSGVRTAARWLMSNRAAVTLSAEFQKARIGGQNQVNGALGDLEVDTQVPDPQHDDIDLYSLEFNYHFDWSDLTFVGGMMKRDSDTQLDVQFGPQYPAFFTSDQRVLSGELRLASTRPGKWSWVAGTFAKKWDHDNNLSSDGVPVAPGVVTRFVAAVDFTTEIASGFGDVTYAFNDRWSGTVGLRYFQQEQHDVTLTNLPIFGVIIDQSDLTEDFTDLSPKFGVSWRARDNALLYATVAKGYRAGGTNPLHASNPNAPLGYEADVVWSYETGAKTATRDGRFTASGALFFMQWDNLQISGTPENSLLGYTTNAGKAESKGLELELGAHVVRGLDLDFGAAWTDAVLVEPAEGGEPGNRLPFVPRTMFNVSAQYEWPLGNAMTGIARGDYSWRGDSYRDVTNDLGTFMDAYSLANLRVGIRRAAWEVSAFVKNVGDVRADLDRNAVLYYGRNEPRTIGVNVRFHPAAAQ